jgi:hypothetical protein
MPDIWLSYVRTDRKRVALIAQALEREGFSVAWDREIKANEPWEEEIDLRLEESPCHCVCWSKASAASDSIVAEASYGQQAGKLVPVTLQACDPPEPFNEIPSWDLTQWRGDSEDEDWQGCVQAIRQLVEPTRQAAARTRPQPLRAPPPPPPPPAPEILVAKPSAYDAPDPPARFKKTRRGDRREPGFSPSRVLGGILVWMITLAVAAVLIYRAAPGISQFARGHLERTWPALFGKTEPAQELPSNIPLPAMSPSDTSTAPPDLSTLPPETLPPEEAPVSPSRLPPVKAGPG